IVRITFERGGPTALDDARLDPVTLVERLNRLAGRHGVGRIDILENRLVGFKVRGVYESPAATVLYEAHRELENMVCERDLFQYKAIVSHKYAELIYDAKWFSALRSTLDAFFADIQERVSGTVSVRLYKGSATVLTRSSPHSLYHHDYASYEAENEFDQRAGEGFSYIWSMQARVSRLRAGA
ncbi:MAG TPA: argininosuccinate synthase, partial [Phytomonospora sp.]